MKGTKKLYDRVLTVALPAPMQEALQELADRDGISTISSHVRLALKNYLADQETAHVE